MTPHRKPIRDQLARREPPCAETVEMLDGRQFYSDDGWATVWMVEPGEEPRKIAGRQADLARFLAVASSSAG